MARLEAIANAISNDSGAIEISKLDALDEQSVAEHMNEVIKKAGKVDISFNAIGILKNMFKISHSQTSRWKVSLFRLSRMHSHIS
jgi:NADP-dependent 3-hydroxy acid dehydrogenase YdfG